MSVNLSYTFPVCNTQDVCFLQLVDFAGNKNMHLNGNLANPVTKQVSFISYGYSRSISITASIFNANTTTVTIIGTQNGVVVTENILGPMAYTTVYGTLIYDTIISISVNSFCEVSVGTGPLGFFPLIGINLEKLNINYTLSVSKLITNFIPTSLYGAIQNISENRTTFISNISNNNNLFDLTSNVIPPISGGSTQYYYNNMNTVTFGYLLVGIEGTTANLNDSLQLNFTQI